MAILVLHSQRKNCWYFIVGPIVGRFLKRLSQGEEPQFDLTLPYGYKTLYPPLLLGGHISSRIKMTSCSTLSSSLNWQFIAELGVLLSGLPKSLGLCRNCHVFFMQNGSSILLKVALWVELTTKYIFEAAIVTVEWSLVCLLGGMDMGFCLLGMQFVWVMGFSILVPKSNGLLFQGRNHS